MNDLKTRIARDAKNAEIAKEIALKKLEKLISLSSNYFALGSTNFAIQRQQYERNQKDSLIKISKSAFHAMAEVEVETNNGSSKEQLWYANRDISNNMLLSDDQGNRINILSWTHPGIQVALSAPLDCYQDISHNEYTLTGITIKVRAKINQIYPSIAGIYEPGGTVGEIETLLPPNGLRAVKLDMTNEQVKAFISRMSGIMFVTGAPGSGKTTVAFQRVRFLFDQKDLRLLVPQGIDYLPERTKIFLANQNLIDYAKTLLEDELSIPIEVVELVPGFINKYISDVWVYKHDARMVDKKYDSRIDERARDAFFSLCLSSDLSSCWKYYENQIAVRLQEISQTKWFTIFQRLERNIRDKFINLSNVLSNIGKTHIENKQISSDPLLSGLRIDAIFNKTKNNYATLRETLPNKKLREKFDEEFLKWIYYVYDPLDCIKAYFSDHLHEAGLRIMEGTAAKADEKKIFDDIFNGWEKRIYGREEQVWLAWLLRFALSEETKQENRFRNIPCALKPALINNNDRWTHIVIDEAQDLSVAEASFLCSFVHPKGALTISSDFRQIVSPVHGMENPEAIKIGCPIRDRSTDLQFPFSKNMRQTKQITNFLRAYYNNSFHEPPPFIANENFEDIKPQLHICSRNDFPIKIKQMVMVIQRSVHINTIALLQINEDEDELLRLRRQLEKMEVVLAPIWEPYSRDKFLITSSVERIKGLEYDCCIIIGMDNIEQSSLKHTVNRAYVAISRPTRRLAMLCEKFPKLLHGVDKALFDIM